MTVYYTDPFGPAWKLPWLRMMMQWKGSIFQSLWIEFVCAMTLCALLLLIWYLTEQDTTSTAGETSSEQRVYEAFSYVTGRFQSALSLMLGFYTSTLYGRWWNIRTVESAVRSGIDDLSVQLAALIRDNEQQEWTQQQQPPPSSRPRNMTTVVADKSAAIATDDERDRDRERQGIGNIKTVTAGEVRMNLVRWLNLAHAIAIGDLYGKKPNEFSSLEAIMDYGLLTQQEYEYMRDNPRSQYQAPFVWFLNVFQDMKDGKCFGISDATMLVVCQNVTKIRSSLAELYMCKSVPVPLSYRQLVNWTVRLYLLMFALAAGLETTFTFDESSGGLKANAFLLLLPFGFEYFMFVGWLSLADALGNPFREWVDGFEYENYVKWASLSSNLYITKAREASPSLENIREVSTHVEEKEAATLSRWSHPAPVAEPFRVKLTGF